MRASSFLANPTKPDMDQIGDHGRHRQRLLGIGVLIGILSGSLLAGCGKPQTAVTESKLAEVVATTPITDEVRDFEDFTGRLDALKTVDIRARVTGYVKQVPFKEGDQVKEGDLLFQIDPDPYQADLDQAEANVKLAEADVRLQQRLTERTRRLIGTASASQEDYDRDLGALEKAQATVGSMKAARDRAKLYLNYTRVLSPVSGRISRRFVDPGNLVKADDTILTTIVTEDPLYAYFDVNERTYLDLLKGAPSEVSARSADAKLVEGDALPVLMRLANEDEFTRLGRVDFIDNRIIGTMGTVRMRGVFDNLNKLLKPGLFVRIRLPIGAPYQALLISDEALMSDQGRKYVYVINDQNIVVYRPVVLGQGIHGLRVIKQGLSEGDRVIISGMQRVRPDMTVHAAMQDPPERPASPLGRVLASPRGQSKN
jgi:RND family efflux transporter MFP subunit